MSGHSKWSQIKHKKGIADQKRGQLFSKLSKLISVAARSNPDPATNPRLQNAIEHARTFNVPKDNIERAIKRAQDKDAAALDEISIQAIGPSSVALIIQAITDNRNRTINEVKKILSDHDSKMAGEGSLNWMFDKDWNPVAPMEVTDEQSRQKIDTLMEALDNNDDVEDIHTNLKD
jgi:YebC/PmpR family DNA-binding regulatory protein